MSVGRQTETRQRAERIAGLVERIEDAIGEIAGSGDIRFSSDIDRAKADAKEALAMLLAELDRAHQALRDAALEAAVVMKQAKLNRRYVSRDEVQGIADIIGEAIAAAGLSTGPNT